MANAMPKWSERPDPVIPPDADIHSKPIIMALADIKDDKTWKTYLRLGIVVQHSPGRYDVLRTLHRSIKYLREMAAGRLGYEGADVATEGALLKRSQRELTEYKLRQIRGELVEVKQVGELWGELVADVRQLAISWPAKAAFELPHLSPHDIAVMKRIAAQELADLADLKRRAPPLPQPKALTYVE